MKILDSLILYAAVRVLRFGTIFVLGLSVLGLVVAIQKEQKKAQVALLHGFEFKSEDQKMIAMCKNYATYIEVGALSYNLTSDYCCPSRYCLVLTRICLLVCRITIWSRSFLVLWSTKHS